MDGGDGEGGREADGQTGRKKEANGWRRADGARIGRTSGRIDRRGANLGLLADG